MDEWLLQLFCLFPCSCFFSKKRQVNGSYTDDRICVGGVQQHVRTCTSLRFATRSVFALKPGWCFEKSTKPPKFNMEPEDHGFQKDLPFPGTFFRFHVKFRGCNGNAWAVTSSPWLFAEKIGDIHGHATTQLFRCSRVRTSKHSWRFGHLIQMFSFQTGDVQVSCEFFWGVVCFGTSIDTPRITLRNCLVEDGIKKKHSSLKSGKWSKTIVIV